MKSLILATAALASLPLFAADTQTAKQSANEPTVSQTSAPPAESPLVAAARKSKRLDGKKRVIITNESLKDAKGHVSTSNITPVLPSLPPVQIKTEKELIADQAKAKAEAQRKAAAGKQSRQAEAQRKARQARLADMAEGADAGYGEEDPAEIEKRLEDNGSPKKPQ